MHIKSDSPIVKQQLEFIASTVIENGGFIHPELCINHQDEQLWVSCSAESISSPLLIIPDELFIPVTELVWFGENGILSYSGDTSTLSIVQHTLLDAMVSIYNATDKIRQVAEHLPRHLLPNDQTLLAWLMDANFSLPKTSEAQKFIGTRTIVVKHPSDELNKLNRKLMPLIDLLNHHSRGSEFKNSETGGWLIDLEKPNSNSDECYIRYNNNDNLHLAFWYGFFDPNTDYLGSLDCTLQHTVFGDIHIASNSEHTSISFRPEKQSNEFFLTIQKLHLKQKILKKLSTYLGLAFRSKIRYLTQVEAEILANELIDLLIAENQKKYRALLEICKSGTEKYPLRLLFGQVANHHLNLLEEL